MEANINTRSIAQVSNEELLQAVIKMCKDLNMIHAQDGVYNLYDAVLELKEEVKRGKSNP